MLLATKPELNGVDETKVKSCFSIWKSRHFLIASSNPHLFLEKRN